jgi:hypothetical protein
LTRAGAKGVLSVMTVLRRSAWPERYRVIL